MFRLGVQELRFKNHVYKNEDSELKYDAMLQAMVCNKLGAEALSLEEQRERGVLPKAGERECLNMSSVSYHDY